MHGEFEGHNQMQNKFHRQKVILSNVFFNIISVINRQKVKIFKCHLQKVKIFKCHFNIISVMDRQK